MYVYFLDDEALAKLHDEVFSDPSLTDTITLPIDPPGSTSRPHILGEAFISPKAAIRFYKTVLRIQTSYTKKFLAMLSILSYTCSDMMTKLPKKEKNER